MERETGNEEGVSDSLIPGPLPIETLQTILQYVPFGDLLRCREVNTFWRDAAADMLQKKCAPLSASSTLPEYDDIVRAFVDCVKCKIVALAKPAMEDGRFPKIQDILKDFPITKFNVSLDPCENNWIYEWEDLFVTFMDLVSRFARELCLTFSLNQRTKRKLEFFDFYQGEMEENLKWNKLKTLNLNVTAGSKAMDKDTLCFIRKTVIERAEALEDITLHISWDSALIETTLGCIQELGIGQNQLTKLYLNGNLNYMCKFKSLTDLQLKLKYFTLVLGPTRIDKEDFKKFLTSQAKTLVGLELCYKQDEASLVELPKLDKLVELSIYRSSFEEGQVTPTFQNISYTNLPAIKRLRFEAEVVANCFFSTNIVPSETLTSLMLLTDALREPEVVVRQASRLFPKMRTLGILNIPATAYMREIYDTMGGLEELHVHLVDERHCCVDNLITGLSEDTCRNIQRLGSPSWIDALATLQQPTNKTLTSLKALKVIKIIRKNGDGIRPVGGNDPDFTEISGFVFKQMRNLKYIDFGVRSFPPVISESLREDLEKHGIKLVHQRPRHRRSRTDFQAHDTDSESESSGSEDGDDNDIAGDN